MRRRDFLAATATGLSGLAGCLGTPGSTGAPADSEGAGGTVTADLPEAVGLETVAGGLRGPLDVAFIPGADRQYVAEQQGTVRVVDGGELQGQPLLDLRETVVTGFEQGLLGIALHPEFADTRRLFVRYSAPPRAGTPDGYSHTFVLSEFRVRGDGLSVVPDSERTLLEIPEPQANHNAGSVLFGPDGHLYVGVGDGGAGGDQGTGHVDDWYDAVDGGNGQDVTENLLGSILRLELTDQRGEYAVPEDNPLVGEAGLDEHYAWGFRNPWRLAFDGEELYAGDVGQNRFEEIDRVVAGGNYGWNVKEATHCFQADSCPDQTPDSVRGGEPLLDPVVEYPHDAAPVSGISVITGNVYRGSALPGLQGQFVFGDYEAGGQLFVATPQSEGLWPTAVLSVAEGDAGKLQRILSFGRNEGELYVLGTGSEGGGLYRLAPSG
jgi:glucose/arabinose dehydrogenase